MEYLLKFQFDAVKDCVIKIYIAANEIIDNSQTSPRFEVESESSEWTSYYKKGFGQTVERVIDLAQYKVQDLVWKAGTTTWPLVICLETVKSLREKRSRRRIDSQMTYATLLQCDDGSFEIKSLEVKIRYAGRIYLEQELYGQGSDQPDENENNASALSLSDQDSGKECVICISEFRTTAVLPCRHLCLCSFCTDSFRTHTNKCPICRSPVKALLKIKTRKTESKSLTHVEPLNKN